VRLIKSTYSPSAAIEVSSEKVLILELLGRRGEEEERS
jgi:hypothetical protein